MGTRGPLPKSIAAKHLAGTTRPDRVRTATRTLDAGADIEDPPIALEREGADLWREIYPELRRLGLLARLDRAALAALCSAWQRIAEARRQIKRSGGAVVKDANGDLRMSPWFRIEKASVETFIALGAQFGATPAARARLESMGVKLAEISLPASPSHDTGPTLAELMKSRPQ